MKLINEWIIKNSNLDLFDKQNEIREFAKELGKRRVPWFHAEQFILELCKRSGLSPKSKEIRFYMEAYEGAYRNKGALILKDRFRIRYIFGMYHIYRSSTGIYEPLNELEIEQMAYDIFSTEGNDISVKECREYLEQLKAKGFLKIEDTNLHINEGYIKFKNGLYYRDTKTLSEHRQEHNSITNIDTDFDREANSPQWFNFIDRTFNLCNEKEKTINLLQEFMGYSLLLGNKYQKCLMLIGKPRTGKSVILNVWEEILGKKNVTPIPFEDLSDETKIGKLLGKHINVTGELKRGKKIDTTLIKSLIGEDKVKGRNLYKEPFYFINEAKLVTAGNYLPHFDDISGAMLERTLILKLDNVISDDKKDPDLKNKLYKEKEGILKWMLEGLERLTERGKFDEPTFSADIKEEMELKANPVAWWWKECKNQIFSHPISESNECKTIVFKSAYESYKDFCKDEEISFYKRKDFKEILAQVEKVHIFKDTKLNQEIIELELEIKHLQSPDTLEYQKLTEKTINRFESKPQKTENNITKTRTLIRPSTKNQNQSKLKMKRGGK